MVIPLPSQVLIGFLDQQHHFSIIVLQECVRAKPAISQKRQGRCHCNNKRKMIVPCISIKLILIIIDNACVCVHVGVILYRHENIGYIPNGKI